MALIALVVVAALKETGAPGAVSPVNPVRVAPPEHARPALSAEEEAYAGALWPVHSEVKQSAVRQTFAGLSYKMGESDLASIKTKVGPLTEKYAAARKQAEAIKPPPSFEKMHQDYLEALRLYRDASLEMIKVVGDGKDQHLIDAQAMTERAAVTLLKVGDTLWPGEYKPN